MHMFGVIQGAIPKIIILLQPFADKNQRGAGNFFILSRFVHIGQISVNIHFIRPSNAIGDNHRTVCAIKGG